MPGMRQLTGDFRGRAAAPEPRLGRLATILLGGAIAIASGTVLVKAGSDPQIRETFVEFNKPIRRVVEVYFPKSRVAEPARSSQSRSMQPVIPTGISQSGWPQRGALVSLPTGPLAHEGLQPPPDPAFRERRRTGRGAQITTPGLSTATNYCVRLCDGFAFPIGRAGLGDEGAHEAACRLACPMSPVALYTLPKGARDLSEASHGGASYALLPTAFNYRERYNSSCQCRPAGQTQSVAALLGDFTLRRGDLAMTRNGVLHFDGANRFPHRQANFSDALGKLSDPAEIRRVKGMEAASLRGNLPIDAHARLRERVSAEIRQAAVQAGASRIVQPRPQVRRFEEVAAARAIGPQAVRVIDRRQGLIEIN